MKHKWLIFLIISFILVIQIACSKQDDFPILKDPYLGQKPPSMTAELFAPGIFPKGEIQGCSGFLNDGTVFVFTSMKPNGDWRLRPTYVTELKNGRWTKPQIAPFNEYASYNFTVAPDGQTIHFTTLKSPDKTTSMFMEEANIWAVKLEMDGWTEPVMFGRSINTEKYYENYPSVTNNGTVYYMSRREVGAGRTDVWRSRNIDGKYAEAENVGAPVNTEGSDIDPFISPDESYLIVCQNRDDSYGEFDLYIYFRKHDGSWTEAINMGEGVNSSSFEARPYVTPDGKYLFFTSNRPNYKQSEKIYWIDANIIEELKSDELNFSEGSMKRKWILLVWTCFIFILVISCAKKDDFPVLKGPYLGQKPPGMTPEIFAPGIVCTEKNEGYLVFLDHGRVLVFDRWLPQSEESDPYYVTEIQDGRWTKPQPSSHERNPYNPDLPITPDERTLFFASNRSIDGMGESETGWDMWMTRWTDQGFAYTRRLEAPVSSDKRDAWASLAKNGNLYFMSNRDGGYGRWDIYRAKYMNGGYTNVENIGPVVNSEYSEADPAIAPDKSYLLFCSHRHDGFGESDLYITFRKTDGSWTIPQNMGPKINTPADEEKPYVTPDGKYLFFSNDAPGNLEIYWVDAKIIDDLKLEELKPKDLK